MVSVVRSSRIAARSVWRGMRVQSAQSTTAASDNALANTNNQRQLANLSSQVAGLNTQVVALGGSLRR